MGQKRFRLRWGLRSCALRKAYDLSFASLSTFEMIWVLAEDEEGVLGLGEAVPLPGYSWETVESVSRAVAALVADGRDTEEAILERCRAVAVTDPFAASAVVSAIEMAAALDRLGSRRPPYPISQPVSGDWDEGRIREAVEAALAGGYRYIKCKVGRDLARDREAAKVLLEGPFPQPFKVVFDANQAYGIAEALELAHCFGSLPAERFQWFEQPVDRSDWTAMEAVCAAASVAIVLDEAIYDEKDVERAASIGAAGVKLKLVKNFGIGRTIELSERAAALGMTVVMGNGVATDIGNLAEYLVYARAGKLLTAPGECNGFMKLARPILGDLLSVDAAGSLRCEASTARIRSAIARFADQVAPSTQLSTGISR